ncbi:hypothetical protein GCM10023200_04910 [Actinomycetospora chlora]|uniref:Uncharacterized protein n=1 Tax=Actinomycetospora chlora TaxID=663608 RepID=A0ABP9A7L6_9PSEU
MTELTRPWLDRLLVRPVVPGLLEAERRRVRRKRAAAAGWLVLAIAAVAWWCLTTEYAAIAFGVTVGAVAMAWGEWFVTALDVDRLRALDDGLLVLLAGREPREPCPAVEVELLDGGAGDTLVRWDGRDAALWTADGRVAPIHGGVAGTAGPPSAVQRRVLGPGVEELVTTTGAFVAVGAGWVDDVGRIWTLPRAEVLAGRAEGTVSWPADTGPEAFVGLLAAVAPRRTAAPGARSGPRHAGVPLTPRRAAG